MLAEGARRGLRLAQAREPDLPDAPELLVLDARLTVVSATPLVTTWLDELGGRLDHLPAAVMAVAGRALHQSDAAGPLEARRRPST